MSKVTGSFVFRNEGDGCLTCKYLNDGTPSPLTECSKLDDTPPQSCDPFIGTFTTTWVEDTGVHQLAKLTIKRVNQYCYDLSWVRENQTKVAFTGKAMLYQGNLVGHYISQP
ncbi:MAG: hypothetical protein WC150_06800 [Bacteroidia bacterium]